MENIPRRAGRRIHLRQGSHNNLHKRPSPERYTPLKPHVPVITTTYGTARSNSRGHILAVKIYRAATPHQPNLNEICLVFASTVVPHTGIAELRRQVLSFTERE